MNDIYIQLNEHEGKTIFIQVSSTNKVFTYLSQRTLKGGAISY